MLSYWRCTEREVLCRHIHNTRNFYGQTSFAHLGNAFVSSIVERLYKIRLKVVVMVDPSVTSLCVGKTTERPSCQLEEDVLLVVDRRGKHTCLEVQWW